MYCLVAKFKQEGESAYTAKNAGQPQRQVNNLFAEKVAALRADTDYGSEKLHYVLKEEGFCVSQRQIQKILDKKCLTEPCEKRRGQRKYVRYRWPISNSMWHVDWTEHNGKQFCAYIDDYSRKIMAAGEFDHATEVNATFLLCQAMLTHGVSPIVVLSDKGAQFYANKYTNKGDKGISQFEQELDDLGIEHWTARRGHPQTNGKMEKWFDTLKKRRKRHADESLQDFVKWYNEKRIHHALEYKRPDQVYYEKLSTDFEIVN